MDSTDVVNVQESWRIAKSQAKLRDHGINFFQLLFETYPSWRSKHFTHLGDAPFEILKTQPKFRAHCVLVMSTLNYWVENLDELDLVVADIQKMAKNHAARGVRGAEFETIGGVIIAYMKAALNNNNQQLLTEEMGGSWEKLMSTIVHIIDATNHEDDAANQQAEQKQKPVTPLMMGIVAVPVCTAALFCYLRFRPSIAS